MELVTRVIRLFRTRIHLGPNGGARVGQAPGQEEQTRARKSGRRSPKVATPDPDIDPELAGLYSNLETPLGSDLATVRKAWIRLLRKYHPDLHSDDPEKRKIADELVQGLNGAYEKLRKRLGNETNRQEK